MRYGAPRFPSRGGGPHHNQGRFQHPRPMRGNIHRGGGARPRQPFGASRGMNPMKQKPTVPVKPTVAENKTSPIKKEVQVSPMQKVQENPLAAEKPKTPKIDVQKSSHQNIPHSQKQSTSVQTPRQNEGPNTKSYHNTKRNSGNFNASHTRNFDNQNSGGSAQFYDKSKERLNAISGPQYDLPALDMSEKKFNTASRLFVGNLCKGVTSEELQTIFDKFGECTIFLGKDVNYAFVNFDYRGNALKALRELNNTIFKGRFLKVRFAAISEGLRVKNLSPVVSNELLDKAFSVFGQVETARVIVDGRGMTKGEGIVIFKEKKCAYFALKKCQDQNFVIAGTARPVIVTQLESTEDNEEGLPETSIHRNDDYHTERRNGPHFADHGSYEQEFCQEWKALFELYEQKKKALDEEHKFEMERLSKKLVLARVEFEKDNLRRELAAREAEAVHLRRRFAPGPPERPPPFLEDAPPFGGGAKRAIDGYDRYQEYDRFDQPYDEFEQPYESRRNFGQDGFDVPFAPPDHTAPFDRQYGRRDDFPVVKRPRY